MEILFLIPIITLVFANSPSPNPIKEVPIERFPYQIAVYLKTGIFSRDTYVCTGTLISEDTAISAAHCFDQESSYKIRAGSMIAGSGGTTRDVKIVKHPEFHCENNICDYDIAILHLTKPLELSTKIHPIKLAEINQLIPRGHNGYLSTWGWGDYRKDNELNVPRNAKLRATKLLYTSLCRKEISKNKFCAGVLMGNEDICRIDAGGPFVIDETFYGFVTSINKCGEPFVMMSIPALRQYISNATGI